MPSIRDVAKAADVSPATVSLVLNDRPGAARQTRERVRSTAARMGYRVSGNKPPAQSRKQVFHIAVVCAYGVLADGELTNEARAWMGGIRNAVAASGHHLSVLTAKPHCRDDHYLRQSLDARELHGIVLLGMYKGDGYLDYVRRSGVPCVAFNRKSEDGWLSWVSPDNLATGQAAAEHLLSLNHRRIAICADPKLSHTEDRRCGALTALGNKQLKPAIVSSLHARMSQTEFDEAIDQLIASKATGIVICDWAGARVVDSLTQRGLEVPEQMSVIDIGDMCLATSAGRQLTSMGYDKPWVGEQLGQTVIRLISGKPQLRAIGETFETWVVERDTTAPPLQSALSKTGSPT